MKLKLKLKLKFLFLVYGLFLGMTWQNLVLAANESPYCDIPCWLTAIPTDNESPYCDVSWWETATPADLDKPIENVNEIECIQGFLDGGKIIHTALKTEGLDPVVFFNFLQVNSSELDFEAEDVWGHTPIFYAAAEQSNPVFVNFFLTAGVNLETRGLGLTVLFAATLNHNPEVLQVLLDTGVDKDATILPDDNSDYSRMRVEWNALHFTAENNPNPEVVQTLLDAGFDKSAKTPTGLTAYDIAIGNNPNPEVAKMPPSSRMIIVIIAECVWSGMPSILRPRIILTLK